MRAPVASERCPVAVFRRRREAVEAGAIQLDCDAATLTFGQRQMVFETATGVGHVVLRSGAKRRRRAPLRRRP